MSRFWMLEEWTEDRLKSTPNLITHDTNPTVVQWDAAFNSSINSVSDKYML